MKAIRTVTHGIRTIRGTDFPVESYLEKDPMVPGVHGGNWLVTVRCCNDLAEGTRRFKTKREAMEFMDWMEGGGVWW